MFHVKHFRLSFASGPPNDLRFEILLANRSWSERSEKLGFERSERGPPPAWNAATAGVECREIPVDYSTEPFCFRLL
jgi:hypothetical protein